MNKQQLSWGGGGNSPRANSSRSRRRWWQGGLTWKFLLVLIGIVPLGTCTVMAVVLGVLEELRDPRLGPEAEELNTGLARSIASRAAESSTSERAVSLVRSLLAPNLHPNRCMNDWRNFLNVILQRNRCRLLQVRCMNDWPKNLLNVLQGILKGKKKSSTRWRGWPCAWNARRVNLKNRGGLSAGRWVGKRENWRNGIATRFSRAAVTTTYPVLRRWRICMLFSKRWSELNRVASPGTGGLGYG